MKILFVGLHDWANVSNRVARSINAYAGERIARVFTMHAHPFGYEEDMVADLGSGDDVETLAKEASWVISTGDGVYKGFSAICYGLHLRSDVKLATAHVGSAYRQAPSVFNTADREFGFDKRFIGGDLYRFATGDPRAVPYFAPPHSVATELPRLPDRIRIGHSPTSRDNKGSDTILRVLNDFRDRVDIDLIEGVPFNECVERRGRCHIFVDQMQPDIGGFGASAVEAMAWGCATLADVRNVIPAVDKFYPRPPIIDVQSPRDLCTAIEELLDPLLLSAARRAAHTWACENATPAAIGRYWLEHLK